MDQKTEGNIPKSNLSFPNKNKVKSRPIFILILGVHIATFIFSNLFIFFAINPAFSVILVIFSVWSIFLNIHLVSTIILYKKISNQKMAYYLHLSIYLPLVASGVVLMFLMPFLILILAPLILIWSYFLTLHYRKFKSVSSDEYQDLGSSIDKEDKRGIAGSSNNDGKHYNDKEKNKNTHRSTILILLITHIIIFALLSPQIASSILHWEYYYNWGAILLPSVIWSWIFSLHITFTIFYFRDYSYEKMKLLTHIAIYIPSLVISLLIFDVFFLLVLIILPIWTIILIWHFEEYKSLKNYKIEDGEDVDLWFEEVEGFSEESLRKIAEEKVKYRDSVKIHFFTYILVNILLFILFLILEIPQISFLIVFAWLIALSLHTGSYILYARGTFPMAKRGVAYHFITYLTGSIFLLVLTFILITKSRSPQFISSISSIMSIVILIWGIALLLHWAIYKLFFSVKIERNGEIKTRREMQIEKEIQKMKRKLMRE